MAKKQQLLGLGSGGKSILTMLLVLAACVVAAAVVKGSERATAAHASASAPSLALAPQAMYLSKKTKCFSCEQQLPEGARWMGQASKCIDCEAQLANSSGGAKAGFYGSNRIIGPLPRYPS